MQEINIEPIREELLTKGKNYIFSIKVEGKYGTGFFIDILKVIYLCINQSLISQDFINSKGEINIKENIKIKLDEKRTIIPYNRQCLFISIDKSEIPPDYKIELETDLSTQEYIGKDAYLFAYSDLDPENVSGYIPGKIININGYKIEHQFNTKNLLTVAPICIVNNNQLKVIGVQLENPEIRQYKYMSYGYLLKYILGETNIQFKIDEDSKLLLDNNLNNRNPVAGIPEEKNYFFYTLEQYKNSIIDLHKRISEHYKNQNEQNFNIEYNNVDRPEFQEYLTHFYLFNNINRNQMQIFNDKEIVNNLNRILLSNDLSKIYKFSYFIAGFIYVLNAYSLHVACQFKNDGDLLYTRMKFPKEDLEELDKNLNKIIIFKTFLSNVNSLEHLNGKINSLRRDIRNFFSFDFSDKYDTKIYIEHHFDLHWKACCFNSFPGNDKIFNLFSFFKVKEVKINFEEKYAEIKLEVVGKFEIFEEILGEEKNKNKRYNIEYNKENNVIQISEPMIPAY